MGRRKKGSLFKRQQSPNLALLAAAVFAQFRWHAHSLDNAERAVPWHILKACGVAAAWQPLTGVCLRRGAGGSEERGAPAQAPGPTPLGGGCAAPPGCRLMCTLA